MKNILFTTLSSSDLATYLSGVLTLFLFSLISYLASLMMLNSVMKKDEPISNSKNGEEEKHLNHPSIWNLCCNSANWLKLRTRLMTMRSQPNFFEAFISGCCCSIFVVVVFHFFLSLLLSLMYMLLLKVTLNGDLRFIWLWLVVVWWLVCMQTHFRVKHNIIALR